MKRILSLLLAVVIFNDLSAQKWDTLAPIPESFTFPVVDVLNGRIHIMGGGGAGGATNHHFAYDPASNSWTPKANVPYLAQQPAGAAANGKIHFFGGGYPNSGSPKDDHYVYDPGSDSWAQAADLTAPRAIHYGVGLNGVVYTLAGQGMARLCQTYDEPSNSWITHNDLPDAGFWYGAHVVTEGHIYRFCGGGYTAPNKLAHRYDPAADSWTPIAQFPAATHGIAGAAIGDKIFVAGGYHSFLERDEVWVYDTQTDTYSPGPPLPLGRDYHNMVAIDSCIYVLGGNHAIDQTVRFQLLRLCPFEGISGLKETPVVTVNARYYDGVVYLQIPDDLQQAARATLFDAGGRQLLAAPLSPANLSGLEMHTGTLPPGIYFLQIRTQKQLFVAKVVVP